MHLSDELTNTELEIARLIAEGLSNQEVADKLNFSRRTIEVRTGLIYEKLGINNRVKLARWYWEKYEHAQAGVVARS